MCANILTVIQKLNITVWKTSYRKSKAQQHSLQKKSFRNSKAQQHSLQKVLPKLESSKAICAKIHTETRKLNSIVWKISYTWLKHNPKFGRYGHIIHLCLLHQFISSRYPCQFSRVFLCLHIRYVYLQILQASGEIGTYIVGFNVPLGYFWLH